MYSFRHLADINRDDDDGFGDESHERERLIFSLSTSMSDVNYLSHSKIQKYQPSLDSVQQELCFMKLQVQ